MKVLLLVLDGIADVSHPELGWRTPMQAAAMPNLDRLAAEGCCALMYPLEPGICPSSEVAHWGMFGYAPGEFTGRAYLHALAAGIPCERGDALFMFNLVPVERRPEGLFVRDDSGLPIEDICASWAERLHGMAPRGMVLHYLGGKEFIAVVKGGSQHVRPTDPFLHHHPVGELVAAEGWERDSGAVRTVRILGRFVAEAAGRLGEEAGRRGENLGLIMKWPSRADGVETFEERHGMRAAAVVSTPCFLGMGELLGMRVEAVREGEAGADLEAKLGAAGDLLRGDREFVFVHSKHTDEAAHGGDPVMKREVIAAMDGALSSAWELLEDPDLLTVVTADHSTPTTLDPRVIHGGDPVPVLFHGRTARRDALDRFDEVSAAAGGMGQLGGKDLMPLIRYLSRRAPFHTGFV